MGEGEFYGMFFNLRDGKGWGTGNLTSATIPMGLPWSYLTEKAWNQT